MKIIIKSYLGLIEQVLIDGKKQKFVEHDSMKPLRQKAKKHKVVVETYDGLPEKVWVNGIERKFNVEDMPKYK